MSRFEDGCYGSLKGVALIGKVLAGRCKMHYTRVAVGKGTIPEGMTPKTLEEPPEYVMDAMISSVTNPVDGECQVSVQIDSAAVETGFYATGLQLYAEDPDEGEIPYTYLVLENEPEWIRPASSIVGKLAYFDIIAAVGDVDKVYATIDPDALVTRAAALQMLTEHDADPDAHPDIVRSIMMGALALPLTADTGEALLTSSGRPIHAVYELERALSSKAELGRNSRNILINWDFRRPVNQNGGTRYTESGYTIDRWKIVNGGLSLGDDGAVSLLKNADTGTPRNCLFQLIDTPETYVGRTLTFSVLCKDLQGTLFATAYANKGGTADSGVTGASISSDGLASVTFTIAEDSAPTEFRVHWLLSPGGSCVPIAAKLELGERQTLARQVDGGWGLIDPLDYDLQYALCSQYSQITGARVEDRYINEDLFDNSYFLDPINQSDKTEYTGTGYGIDRWYCSMVQVTAEGIRSMDRGAYIQQKLDGPVKDLLAGREITISCIVNGELYSGTGIYQASLSAQKYLFAGEDIQIVLVTDGSILFWFPDGGKAIKSAKLELGKQQTLAHKEGDVWVLNELPNKMEELLKCQRYYIRARISRPLCFIFDDGGTCSAWVSLKLPVAMRLDRPAVSRFTINSWISHQGQIYDPMGTGVESVEVMTDGSCEKDGNIAFKFALNDDLAHYAAGSLGCIASISLTLNANL